MALFAPVVIIGSWFLVFHRYKISAWLTAASLFFYIFAQINALPVLLLSVAVNYVFACRIVKNPKCLPFGVTFNLLLLGYFKYADFFIANANAVLQTNIEFLNIVLPLGISFFTFSQIAYLVDLSRRNAVLVSFFDYLSAVTFFPQIISGPIIRIGDTAAQIDGKKHRFSWKNMYAALILFIIGFVKKKLADNYSYFVGNLYDADEITFVWAWCGSLAYTFQLYFDFSGYCDMGVAIAKMLDIDLPVNFNSPYKSASIQDFWRRWHITLSTWLKNYLYISLGGSRKGLGRALLNNLTVMLLGGLWHGAGWTFVVWGALHGVALCVCRLWKMTGIGLPKAAACLLTFLFVHIAWVFFRANDISQAFDVLSQMFCPTNFTLPHWIVIRKYVPPAVIGVLCAFFAPNSMKIYEDVKRGGGGDSILYVRPVFDIFRAVCNGSSK